MNVADAKGAGLNCAESATNQGWHATLCIPQGHQPERFPMTHPQPCKALPFGGMTGTQFDHAQTLHRAISAAPTKDLAVLIREAFPTRQSVRDFYLAHQAASWPATYGQSPVEHVADIAEAFEHARHLNQRGYVRNVAEARQQAFQWLVLSHGGPVLQRRFRIGYDDATRLWPRLVWACRQAALLTEGEAASALVLWFRSSHLDRMSRGACAVGGSEAVSHFGGVRQVLAAAKRWRRMFVTGPRREGRDAYPSVDPQRSGAGWWHDPVGGTFYPSRESVATHLPAGRFAVPSRPPDTRVGEIA